MTGWETTVNTGNPEADRMTLEQYRRAAESQGMTLQVQPLPAGGFHVRAAPQAQGYGAPAGYGAQPAGGYGQAAAYNPAAGYGASPQPQGSYGAPPQQAYGQPAQQAYGPPAQQAYGPPAQQAYGQPAQQAYGQPAAAFGGGGAAWGQAAYAGMPGGAAPAAGGVVAAVQDGIQELGRRRILHLRKVYGLLAVAALLAIGCGFIAITVGDAVPVPTGTGRTVKVPPIVAAMILNEGLMYGAFALLFVSTLGASVVSKVKYLNLVALLFVSALMGVELAPMVFVAQYLAGMGATMSADPVRDAFILVGAIFVGITAYSLFSKKDFSYLGATLTMGFFVIFGAALLAAVIGSEIFTLAVASAGALLAAGFLLYNTSLILKGDMDDPVGDALGLLVQLRNLFMWILRILMSSRN